MQGEGERASGGIVLAGWSFGGQWMLAFLANTLSLPPEEVRLSKYVRRVIVYGMFPFYSAMCMPFDRLI